MLYRHFVRSVNRPRAAYFAGIALMGVCLQSPAQAAPDLRILGLFKDRAVVTIDGKRRILKAGKASPEGIKLISADSEAAVVEFAGKRQRLTLGRHINSTFAPPPKGVQTTVWPDPRGMYYSVGSINGLTVRFLLDTGATYVAMSRRQARRLGIQYRLVGEPQISATAAGHVRSYAIRLKSVKLGDIELRDVPASVIDADAPRDVLLGNSFLGRLKLSRDGAAMILTRP